MANLRNLTLDVGVCMASKSPRRSTNSTCACLNGLPSWGEMMMPIGMWTVRTQAEMERRNRWQQQDRSLGTTTR